MSASTSGSQPKANGSAMNREHNQGSQDRKYTPQQKAEVIRIRRCGQTAFYEILSVEKSASDAEIKKAYRKISLLTHPDKNGYEGADEAFKLVSRAFQVLSDADKKSRYDQFGGDPDSRFSSSSAGASSPFSGFARASGGRAHPFEGEMSPEELFNQFFGGGGAFGGPFGFGGPQVVFNMGGGPGFRVHRMGGQNPRTRPPGTGQSEEGPTGLAALTQLLPLILLFVLPLLSSLFSGSGSSGPSMRFDTEVPPYTMARDTPRYKVRYYVDPTSVDGWTKRQFSQLDQRAELSYVSSLEDKCEAEIQSQRREINDATGFFFTDEDRLRRARQMPMPGCSRLNELRVNRQY